jgi:hypothetical protein
MAKVATTGSTWQCTICHIQVYDARDVKRLKCRWCLHWMTKLHPR